jgi:hypothetical protein
MAMRRYGVSARIPASDLRWILRCIIPGLPQMRMGQGILGRCILVAWLLVVLAALVLAGGTAGWFLYALALCLHSMGIGLALSSRLASRSTRQRVVAGLAVFACLQMLVYWPALYLAGGFVVPVRVFQIQDAALVRNGDTLLRQGYFLRTGNYRYGELVMYSIGQQSGPGYHLEEGVGLDRIVGLPGDRVTLRGGVLLVNGRVPPAQHRPLMPPAELSANIDIQAGPDEYVILPSLLAFSRHGNISPTMVNNLYNSVSRVKHGAVLGKIFWRIRPFSRYGAVE